MARGLPGADMAGQGTVRSRYGTTHSMQEIWHGQYAPWSRNGWPGNYMEQICRGQGTKWSKLGTTHYIEQIWHETLQTADMA